MVSESPSQKKKQHTQGHSQSPCEGQHTARECPPPTYGCRSPVDLCNDPTRYVEPNGPPKRCPCYEEQVEVAPRWAVLQPPDDFNRATCR